MTLEVSMDEPPDWSWMKRPEDLDLNSELIERALYMAAADARGCTALDSPGAAGYLFWSRANRYLREALLPEGWKFSNRDWILRTIHPSGAFAITAMSGWGGVADLDKDVRAKNPKGAAVAQLVERNGKQMSLFDLPDQDDMDEVESKDTGGIPTFFILYQENEFGEIDIELSLPVEMHGKYVDTWRVRIPIGKIPPFGDGGGKTNINPNNSDEGPDFDVTYKG
ncbi:hypothetical protein [Microbispora bryophytorum]|uniref:hypothetical protein n=1 Tax=Microbispora bryophytorum TaxID=1460882 RepID=UPI0033C4CD02